VAVPKKSITGRCQSPHKSPIIIPDFNLLIEVDILYNAKPVQPISSKKPAGIPKRIPIGKKFILKESDTIDFKIKRVSAIRTGGMVNAKIYHLIGIFHLKSRDLRFCKPSLPSVASKEMIPARLVPNIIIGNINSPSVLGIASPANSFGAIKIKAPVQENKNAKQK
jgi:hypothetical protein